MLALVAKYRYQTEAVPMHAPDSSSIRPTQNMIRSGRKALSHPKTSAFAPDIAAA
jgi:hypothetical protein